MFRGLCGFSIIVFKYQIHSSAWNLEKILPYINCTTWNFPEIAEETIILEREEYFKNPQKLVPGGTTILKGN